MKKRTHIESAGVSDVGMQRECNEDALASSDALGLYAVADGMGGHMHGDVASKTTIETLLREVTRYHEGEEKGEEQQACYDAISHAITECNNSILQKNHDNDSKVGEGMGTTLVGAYFLKNSLHVLTFNVGDSRIYRLRDDSLEQITRDQTMYQEWVEAGQKGLVPSQNILINAIGLVENLAAEIKLENVILGDVLLICSDGLSGLVDDQTLKRFMRENAMLSVGEMCSKLVQVANKNGGHDNITVIIVRIGCPKFLEPVKTSNSHATMPRIKSV